MEGGQANGKSRWRSGFWLRLLFMGTNVGMEGIKAGMKGYFYGYREGKIVLFFQITEVKK